MIKFQKLFEIHADWHTKSRVFYYYRQRMCTI